ncbi:MAG: hypothetical protein IPO47_07570 [Bacteroidetes bacterium]|nr:hypothetical protein [Bacteroidota bacterium]
MALLKLKSITCISQAEFFTDELFVTFNGTKINLPDMNQGETKSLNIEFTFQGSQQLSLFEDDGDHWYDGDDFIAKHTINETTNDFTLDFESTSGEAIDAHYTISVSVDSEQATPSTARLRLNSISCIEQAETFTDELYVTFNGVKRGLPSMTKGEVKTLSDEFIFEGSPVLSLFEDDGNHWYDSDDFIAKHTITQSALNTTLEFKATGGNGHPGHYLISVTVTPMGEFGFVKNVASNLIKDLKLKP